MPKRSAGLLLFRRNVSGVQVFLVHPGGPLWSRKDAGAWSIPKGEYDANEDPLAAAKREFEEETGMQPAGEFLPLEPIRQRSGKLVTAWAFEGDFNPSQLRSNSYEAEWPPKSGKMRQFPEVDRGEWFSIPDAAVKIIPAQVPLLHDLLSKIS